MLEADAADAPKDGTSHEMVGVRAKPINDVVIIPYVDLGNLRVGGGKGFGAVPAHVILKVVFVALVPELLTEWELSSLDRIPDGRPFFQGPLDSDAIIVYLVPSPDHDVERALFVDSENVIP